MKKYLLRLFGAAAIAVCSVLPLSAGGEDYAPIQGYFRVQSALGTADGTGYVEVRGPFTAAPDLTKKEALTSAGTVMRLRAVPELYNGQVRYKIGNLSSQGIEVFGMPQEDYWDMAINKLAMNLNESDYESMAYSLQRVAREYGYIASGRAMVQALFQIVADRLDSEIAKLTTAEKEQLGYTSESEKLVDFAKRFNAEVSANIDLHAYLEPVGGNQYRLYFNWIDCTTASDFYLKNEQNRKSFELGFACMRHYMQGKQGLGSGEAIDAAEAALWKEWGYDIDAKYGDLKDANGVYHLTYEKIFADHEVLYNWIKMYVERFLDPEKAPDASILGINFKAFATEMQRHAIMQGFLKYIPSIQEGQRLYLTNGRFSDGKNAFSTVGTASDNSSHFGLLDSAHALTAADAAVWNVIPMDETDNYFAIEPVGHRINKPDEEDAHLIAMYVDFPMEAVNPDKLRFHSFGESALQTKELDVLGKVTYIDMGESISSVERRTPVFVECVSTEMTDNIVRIPFKAQDSDYDPAVNKPGFGVTDEEIAEQRAPRRAVDDNAVPYAVLLSTPANEKTLRNLWGIEANLDENSVYDLTTRKDRLSASDMRVMSTPWFVETPTIPANHAFILTTKSSLKPDEPGIGISLGEPADEADVVLGIETPGCENNSPEILYNLKGERVAEIVPGNIYILNGKKILVK